jgi:hypothetical protein
VASNVAGGTTANDVQYSVSVIASSPLPLVFGDGLE